MQELLENILLLAVIIFSITFLLGNSLKIENKMNKKQKKMLIRILITSILLLFLQIFSHTLFDTISNNGHLLRLICYLINYLIIGHDIIKKAWRGIMNQRLLDENFLMVIATIGALILAIIQDEQYLEVVAVMLFYQVGEWFQSYAITTSRQNIQELMDIRPDYANVKIDNQIVKVNPNEVTIGSHIIVNPGEKVPIDGIIIAGESSLNMFALTGETILKDVNVGQEILSGAINMTGTLTIKTNQEFSNSTVSKILELVENAAANKAQSEKFISKFAHFYTPIVCLVGLSLFVIPPIFNFVVLRTDPEISIWSYRALTFLVASCPCALVISIPLTFFAGIGGASRKGILIKGANFIESLAKAKIIVFDKTGTLTQGNFVINDIHHNQIEKQQLIEYVILLETASSHPIGQSLLKEYNQPIDYSRLSNIMEISGNGVVGEVDGNQVAVGNNKLMKKLNINYIDCHSIGTIIHVAINNQYAGHLVINDKIKDNSYHAIKQLKSLAINKIIMLTGDLEKVASIVAKQLKIDEYYSQLLPQHKVAKVEELLINNHNDKLVFVGDGINDAPVLTRADVGIAMGGVGSDAAIEAADVVLMDDNPEQIVKAIKIAKRCLTIVYQNISFSIGIKILCLLAVMFGFSNMWFAIFADVGVMILATLNAMRVLNNRSL